MTDDEFMMSIYNAAKNLPLTKSIFRNEERYMDVLEAERIAKRLFKGNDRIYIRDDCMTSGALSLCVHDLDISAVGAEGMKLFYQMTAKADNFSVYRDVDDEEGVILALMFYRVYTVKRG